MMSSFRRGFSLVSFLGVSHVFIFYFWLLFSLRHGSRSCSLDLTLGISGLSGALRCSLPCHVVSHMSHRVASHAWWRQDFEDLSISSSPSFPSSSSSSFPREREPVGFISTCYQVVTPYMSSGSQCCSWYRVLVIWVFSIACSFATSCRFPSSRHAFDVGRWPLI